MKAGPKAKPVLRGASGRSPILDLEGGRATIEGLEFVIEPAESDEGATASGIRATDAELTLRRCTFRRPASAPALANGTAAPALDLRASGLATIDARAFGPGLAGIAGEGPVQVVVRDGTFAGSDPAVRLRGAEGGGADVLPAHLWMSHVSILAGDRGAFRFTGRAPVIRLDDSVVAASGDIPAVLVAAMGVDDLDWRGLRNLYGRIGAYFEAADGPSGGRPSPGVWDFETWSDGPLAPRESGSLPTDARVWAETDPLAALAGKEPARAFRLGPVERPARLVGARKGPKGPVPAPAEPPALALNTARPTRPPTIAVKPTIPEVIPPVIAPSPAPMPAPSPKDVDPATMDESPMPIKPLVGVGEGEEMPGPMALKDEEDALFGAAPRPRHARDQGRRPAETAENRGGIGADPTTTAQFLDALKRAGPKGATLRLAADADLALPPCELRGAGRWTIEGEAGESRPRLRFVPGIEEVKPPGAWVALFRLRAGSLHIQGVDIVLRREDVPDRGRWAAFVADAGTDLTFSRCLVHDPGRAGAFGRGRRPAGRGRDGGRRPRGLRRPRCA